VVLTHALRRAMPHSPGSPAAILVPHSQRASFAWHCLVKCGHRDHIEKKIAWDLASSFSTVRKCNQAREVANYRFKLRTM
jgi:hypothetical protein